MSSKTIEAFAAPFNVRNSYGESIAPGAFDNFLAKNAGKPLPMHFQHGGPPVGRWTEFTQRKDGLYVRGELEDYAVSAAKWRYPEVSITFYDDDNEDGVNVTLTNARAQFIKEVNGLWKLPSFVHTVPTALTRHAGLAEISLVDSGAFPGTGYRFV